MIMVQQYHIYKSFDNWRNIYIFCSKVLNYFPDIKLPSDQFLGQQEQQWTNKWIL